MLQKIRDLISNLGKMFPQIGKLLTRFDSIFAVLVKVGRILTPLGLLVTAIEGIVRLFTDLAAEIEKGVEPVIDAVKAFHNSFLGAFGGEDEAASRLAAVEEALAENDRLRKEAVFGPEGSEGPQLSAEERDQLLRELLEEKNRLLDERKVLESRLEALQAGGEQLTETSVALVAALQQITETLAASDLPGRLEALARAVEAAAARIAEAIHGPAGADGTGPGPGGRASGGDGRPWKAGIGRRARA